MDYITAQKTAFTDIMASNEDLIKTMSANYKEALTFLQAELNKLYASLAKLPERDWYTYAIKTDRLNSLIRAFQDNFNKCDALAGKQIKAIAADAMQEMYYRTQYIQACFTPEVMTLSTLPSNLLEACVTGQAAMMDKLKEDIIDKFGSLDDYLPKYEQRTLKSLLAERNYQAISEIQQSVMQGILRGQSINQITESISHIFNGIDCKAQMIARTEALRTASAGQWACTQELKANGVKVQKMWLSNLDDRTRTSHRHLDGKKVGVDGKFTVNGHSALYPRGFGVASEDINCRCTYCTLAGDIEPKTRTAYNPNTGKKEIFTFKNYQKWREDNGLETMTLFQ